MDSYTLYVALRADRSLDDAAVAAVGAPLRPDDEDLCIWRDADAPAVLRVSADCLAADLEAALELGHASPRRRRRSAPGSRSRRSWP